MPPAKIRRRYSGVFHDPDDCAPCAHQMRRKYARPAVYRTALRNRANEVTVGPTGWRNRATFEMLAHGVLCGRRLREGVEPWCTCPDGYDRWFMALAGLHPIVAYWLARPQSEWPNVDEASAIATALIPRHNEREATNGT